MAGDFYNVDNVVVGNAMLMIALWDKADLIPIPDDDTPIFSPADAGWGADWVSAGATSEGFKLNIQTSTTQITIEEQSTPVGQTVESKSISIDAILAEATMQAMKYSLGGDDIVHTVAGVGQPAKDTMVLTDEITYYTLCLESRNFNGMARRAYVPKASITGSGEVAFRRAADKQMFPVTAPSLCKPSDIEIVDITAPAS